MPRGFRVALVSLVVFSGTGAAHASAVEDFLDRAGAEWKALVAVISGKKSPLAKAAPSDPARPDEQQLRAARLRGNAELLKEMWSVSTLQEPGNRTRFGMLVDSLNQGASLEGIYNGLVNSADYRALEEASPAAPVPVLEVFAEEFAILRLERESERQGGKKYSEELLKSVREQLKRHYAGGSLFQLKRELGTEAIRLISEKKARPERLAYWYSRWVDRIAERKVPFGLAARDRRDVNFHYAWALEDPLDLRHDLLTWEVLNRLHRVLNAAR